MSKVSQGNYPFDIKAANPEDIKAIVELDQIYFHPIDMVDENTFKAWQGKNNSVFTVMRTAEGVAGYYSLLWLTRRALNGIIDGTFREQDIKANDILSKKQILNSQALYLYSVAMKRKHSRLILPLLKHLEDYLKYILKRGCLAIIYAMAVTADGELLLRNLGFQKTKEVGETPNIRSLYSRDLTNARAGIENIFTHRALNIRNKISD